MAHRHFQITILSLLTTAFLGCTGKYAVPVSDRGTPDYRQLLISYEQSTSPTEPTSDPSTLAKQVMSETPAGPQTLRIEYPHPAGRPGYGQATLTRGGVPSVSKQASWWQGRQLTTPEMVEQSDKPHPHSLETQQAGHTQPVPGVWKLDLDRQRLDQLLVECANSGFFESANAPIQGTTRLSFEIDRGRTAKPWNAHPALDAIAHEVHTNGSLAELD